MKIEEIINGNVSIQVASVMGNLASVYFAQGEYQKSLEHYQKSLDISEHL